MALLLASSLGIVLMLLYYLPLGFPKPSPHAFVVDAHIVYAFVLLCFAMKRAGRVGGLDGWCANLLICRKYPRLHAWFGS